MNMKGLTLFTALSVLMSVLSFAMPVNGEMEIYDKVIRLHVIADSDSPRDQELKLGVRDALLKEMEQFYPRNIAFEDALEILTSNIDRMEKTANAYLENEGCENKCSIIIEKERYPARVYDGVTLPKGEYMSVKAVIGKGEGENWWCVMFPPLCLGAASPEESLMEAGLTADEVDILTDSEDGRYVLKFKLLEFFKQVFR